MSSDDDFDVMTDVERPPPYRGGPNASYLHMLLCGFHTNDANLVRIRLTAVIPKKRSSFVNVLKID
ncbi:hypothetical protein DOY81_012937 [Sarcophaga bullata]|nr:hypothetical protein DOY81_012937 [Sarcophaga bullata]